MKLSKLHQDQRKRRKKRKKKERTDEDQRQSENENMFQQHILGQSTVMPDRAPNTDMRQFANLDRAF